MFRTWWGGDLVLKLIKLNSKILMKLKRIDSIKIEYVRGISKQEFKLGLIPNKPNVCCAKRLWKKFICCCF
jgi:hypothetical protein